MPTIQDKEISKTYEKVVEGKGMFVNFYLVGGEKKFSTFVSKGKTVPKTGMRIALMEWEEVKEGEYLNNKVKNIVWMGADTEQATGKVKPVSVADKNNPLWFCMSYAKDIQVARIQSGQADLNFALEDHCLEVAKVAIDMLRFVEHPVDLAKEKGIDTGKHHEAKNDANRDAPTDAQGNEIDPDEIPF